jgi:hypothetical protein
MCARFGHLWAIARRQLPCRIWNDVGVVDAWYCPRCARVVTGAFDR